MKLLKWVGLLSSQNVFCIKAPKFGPSLQMELYSYSRSTSFIIILLLAVWD